MTIRPNRPIETSLMSTYSRSDLAFVRGEGVWLFDKKGKMFLDLASGIAVNSLGYSNPYLNDKLKKQIDKLWHLSNVYQIPEQEKLAQRLCDNSFADYVFFCNSGTEAIEASIKIARRYFHSSENWSHKKEILSFSGSFHGRTIGALAAGGPDKLSSFNTTVNDFKFLEFGDHEQLQNSISEKTAAVIIEPIQGEGGIREVPRQCLEGLRKICDENNCLLIFDEVQCGMGRTGKLFAYEWSEVNPDIMTIAKAIGNGFPLGACLTSKKVGEKMDFGSHGSTFGGNPLACTVGNAVLDQILKKGFLQNVKKLSEFFHLELNKIKEQFPKIIKEVRGKGLLIGLQLNFDQTKFIELLMENRLLTIRAAENVIRILPPLNVKKSEISFALKIIRKVCKNYKI